MLLIKPGYVTDGIGLALLAIVIVNQRFLNRASAPASQPAGK